MFVFHASFVFLLSTYFPPVGLKGNLSLLDISCLSSAYKRRHGSAQFSFKPDFFGRLPHPKFSVARSAGSTIRYSYGHPQNNSKAGFCLALFFSEVALVWCLYWDTCRYIHGRFRSFFCFPPLVLKGVYRSKHVCCVEGTYSQMEG